MRRDSRDRSTPRPTSRVRALLIGGSINQTSQLHAVSRHLGDWDLRFTPFYGDAFLTLLRRAGVIEMSVAGHKLRKRCLAYLNEHDLPLDLDGKEGGYDIVLACSDAVLPGNVRGARTVVIQEGILDSEAGPGYWLARRFRFLPRWFAGTAMHGQSGAFDRFCAASPGYRDHFVSRGADAGRVVVTGIPNFDDCAAYARNDFPHRGYVLACTSDLRETFKADDRVGFLRRLDRLAAGRDVLVKLHPNEDSARARREVARIIPRARVFESGSAEHMIANCDVLVTQWSSTAFVGVALGKEVHSYFGLDALKRLCPIQNGGRSAWNIARVAHEVVGAPMAENVVPFITPRHAEEVARSSRRARQHGAFAT